MDVNKCYLIFAFPLCSPSVDVLVGRKGRTELSWSPVLPFLYVTNYIIINNRLSILFLMAFLLHFLLVA